MGTETERKALEDALMRRKKKQRLIVDVDSTEDPAHGKQEDAAYNGHFGKNCFHPIFAFTGDGDCLGAKLRPDITALCSGDEHGCDKWLTEWPGVRYAQKQDKISFFSNVMTVFPPSALVGDHSGAFQGQKKHPVIGYRSPDGNAAA